MEDELAGKVLHIFEAIFLCKWQSLEFSRNMAGCNISFTRTATPFFKEFISENIFGSLLYKKELRVIPF